MARMKAWKPVSESRKLIKERKPGTICIGPRGYLQDGQSWLGRITVNGKEHWPGFGSVADVSYTEFKDQLEEVARQARKGINPVAVKREKRQQARIAAAAAIVFRTAAELCIEARRPGWRNDKSAIQWTGSLQSYVYPVIGDVAVSEVGTEHLLKMLAPIWATKTETASRVRDRIEIILDFAKVRGWRDGENPARWRGHLEHLLPKPGKVKQVRHHPALDWKELPTFFRELEQQTGVSALALRFAILTAARPGEVRLLSWDEVDLDGALWVIPAARMKAHREHRVPLTPQSVAILHQMAGYFGTSGLVFPGERRGRPLSDMSLVAVLRRMGRDIVAHGFRSSFRDWCAETGKPSDIAEAALAHVIADKTVAAYQRGDLLERRRTLMAQWADFCTSGSGEVVPLRHVG